MGLEVQVGALSSQAESTVVQILNSGKQWPLLKINNKDIPWANLESRLRQLNQNHSKRVVLLKADGLMPYADVVHVIDACRAAEAKVYLVTPAM
jgi:biopolymer transport protein ExbD